MTAVTDCQLAACSAFLASVAISAMIPVAAMIAVTISTATPNGFPHAAPNSTVVATTQHGHADDPEQEAGQQLPAEDRGPADRGGQQPGQRSLVALLEQAGHAERAEKPAGMTMTAASVPRAASARARGTVGSVWMVISPDRPTAARTWPVNCWLATP